jgi:hypothetical protein
MNKKNQCVFFGNHKCASSFIIKIIEQACREIGWKYKVPYRFSDENLHIQNDDELYYFDNSIDFILFPESNTKLKQYVQNFKGFHLKRDPRDILVSGYFSHKHSHSTKNADFLLIHRKKLHELSIEDGLIEEMHYEKNTLSNLLNWDYNDENIYESSYEKMIKDTPKELYKAFDFIDFIYKPNLFIHILYPFIAYSNRIHFKYPRFFPFRIKLKGIPPKSIKRIIVNSDFKQLTKGRKKGEENKKSHYRKGVSGDWKNYFTEMHKEEFKKHYGEGLIRLGYESGNKW